MKRFFRNFIIIFICDLVVFMIASMNAISDDWKLQIMFLGGIISGAIITTFDEEFSNNKIDKL
ncbi:MAG: hypothetical protein J1F35_08300 [Erysipelotrichales bacterium]|nr:hypothetical protein [Erysipelotrichales bacterium]